MRNQVNVCCMAEDFSNIIAGSSSKEEALTKIADHASGVFASFGGIYPVEDFDRISFHFIDLIDQAVFEVRENYPSDPGVRESIFENLFARINLFCEALSNIEIYKANLQTRNLFFEDTILIICFSLSEFNSYLTASFDEYPDLQKAIVKTLLKTATPEETGFFYQTASGPFCYELRILALLGLKLKSDNNIPWNCIKSENIFFRQAVEKIPALDTALLFDEPQGNFFITLFALYYAELQNGSFSSQTRLSKLLNCLSHSLNSDKNSTASGDIIATVSSIVLFFSDTQYETIVKDTALTKILIDILDKLPQDSGINISRRIYRFRSGIADSVNGLFQSGRIRFDDTASSAIKYISLDL